MQLQINCRKSIFVKIIAEPSATRNTCPRYYFKYWGHNNSAADCSNAFIFGTEFYHIADNTSQMFKVKGQGHRIKGPA